MTSTTINDSGRGDCFRIAALTARRVFEEGIAADVWVCHGAPIGTGPDNAGARYWHAWAEARANTAEGVRWVVIDQANGRADRPAILRDIYYQAGQIEARHVIRYRLAKAAEWIVRAGHYGPWAAIPVYGLTPATPDELAAAAEACHIEPCTVPGA